MKLRRLIYADNIWMLEWMHDKDISCFFLDNFQNKTLEDVNEFIETSYSEINQHFACVNENDEYMGTVSLKNINYINKEAEYAIVFRKKAQGSGYAEYATREILLYSFKTLGLDRIYLNVYTTNERAKKFYNSIGFRRFIKDGTSEVCNSTEIAKQLEWYDIKRSDFSCE